MKTNEMKNYTFKGKSIETGEWVTGYLVERESPLYDTIVTPIKAKGRGKSKQEESIVTTKIHKGTGTQWIGIMDQAGRPVYKSDILTTPSMHRDGFGFKVQFVEERAGYVFIPFVLGDENAPVLEIDSSPYTWEYLTQYAILILGNAVDNPELLSADSVEGGES
ncbi:YopX family protein [Listeria phage LIS04]|nr:YopX family protein [Listeria phage LIS04]